MRLAAVVLCMLALSAQAQQKEIKIGFIYDLSGPFAAAGSEPAQIGTKAAVDYVNEHGGVMGYKVNALFADAQSKVDVAINEMTRFIDRRRSTSSPASTRARSACRWRSRWMRARNSCG